MKIICNGEEKEVQPDVHLAELIRELKLNPDTVVAECDGRIVRRDEYEALQLHENCRLELVRFVGGG